MIRLLVLALVLTSVTSAAAQGGIPPKNPLGTYDIGYAAIITYISPQWASGTATVEVTALTPADPLVEPSWLLVVGSVRCAVWTSGHCECPALGGRIRWWDAYFSDGTFDTRWFDLELFTNVGHPSHHVIATGTKRARN